MKNVGIIKENFDLAHKLTKLLNTKQMNIVELPLYNSVQINSLVLSAAKEIEMGGQQAVIEFSRNTKADQIMIIEEKAKTYKTEVNFGGKLIKISIPEKEDTHDWILEVASQMLATKELVMANDIRSRELLALAKKVATTNVTVFINGPTGTGKEVISNFIHNNSSRSEFPFVAVNCAAIPENMLEAILFGHEKGSFTGASQANKGIFRAADGGTLLLDEISEMPLSLQSKLLRVLQERKVTPIGGSKDVQVDVRVVATTNRDMLSEIKKGTFREDLYYRLNVFPLRTLALKERPDDILPISAALLKKHTSEDKSLPLLTAKALDVLKNHSWPGNVRELENVLQRAMVICNEDIITENDIMIDNSAISTEKNLADRIQSGNMVATA
ncbi:MAG: AAA family ATPase [SAR116 cluster bacterium]|nr:AAA family ATPase [SAR116 cluster bacterium]